MRAKFYLEPVIGATAHLSLRILAELKCIFGTDNVEYIASSGLKDILKL
jgi:hypothetical protein